MGKISLLHIGDIHYDDKITHSYPLKHRIVKEYIWSKLSPTARAEISPNLIRVVKKQLFKHIEEETFDAIILSGDLCSRGIPRDYKACLDYLEIQFQNFCKNIRREDIEIAVGNHDLNANLSYSQEHIEERFVEFRNLLESKKLRKYPILDINEKIISTNAGKVLLLNVNSCLEFGNLDLHPKSIRETINRILESENGKKERNRLLNVPFIRDSLMTSICKKIKDNPDCLPVVTTHHNFLRNRFFDPDSEYDGIINDGLIMQKLLDLDRSMLIVHGHIHDDLIRVINSKHGKIIYISAPLLFPLVDRKESVKFGYNVMHIIFSNTRDKIPLGCEIEHYQIEHFSVIKKLKEPIRFFDSASAIERLSDLEKTILKKILCLGKDIYLGSLLNLLKEEKIVNNNYTITELLQIVDWLYWLELVKFRENQTNVEYSILRGWF